MGRSHVSKIVEIVSSLGSMLWQKISVIFTDLRENVNCLENLCYDLYLFAIRGAF
jgi:hypothetical protein